MLGSGGWRPDHDMRVTQPVGSGDMAVHRPQHPRPLGRTFQGDISIFGVCIRYISPSFSFPTNNIPSLLSASYSTALFQMTKNGGWGACMSFLAAHPETQGHNYFLRIPGEGAKRRKTGKLQCGKNDDHRISFSGEGT